MESCLDNYDEILGKAKRTKEWVLKKYKWESISEEYRNIYHSILYSN